MHEDYSPKVEPVVTERWKALVEKGLEKNDKNDAPYRAEIARDIFKALPQDEKDTYVAHTKKDKQAAVAKYEASLAELYTSTTLQTKQQ